MEIISLKLITGELLVAKIISISNDELVLDKPMISQTIVDPSSSGKSLMYMTTLNPFDSETTEYTFKKTNIIFQGRVDLDICEIYNNYVSENKKHARSSEDTRIAELFKEFADSGVDIKKKLN